MVTLEDPPLSYTELLPDGTRIGKGVAFQLLKFLEEKFNFTTIVTVPSANIIGSTTDMAGSLIEILKDSKADIAAAFIPILSDAKKYIYYSSASLDEGEWIMMMLRPEKSASGSNLLAPFDKNVWILILVSLIAVGPVIYLLIVIRFKLTKDKNQTNYPLPHCVWFVYGALMKQGSTLSPIAGKWFLCFYYYFKTIIFLLVSFYYRRGNISHSINPQKTAQNENYSGVKI